MEGWNWWVTRQWKRVTAMAPRQTSLLYEEGQGTPHQSPTLLLLKRQEGGDEATDSQPDSKRASMLSKVGNAVGKTYNLFHVLFHMLKNQTANSKALCL